MGLGPRVYFSYRLADLGCNFMAAKVLERAWGSVFHHRKRRGAALLGALPTGSASKRATCSRDASCGRAFMIALFATTAVSGKYELFIIIIKKITYAIFIRIHGYLVTSE